MSFVLLAAALAWPQAKQQQKQEQKKPATQSKPQQQEQEPPEEDEDLKPKEYSFNPLEAERNLKIGNYYFKRGNFKGALGRFKEASLWNPTYAVAFLRMGDAEEKMKDRDAARQAYQKFLELEPDGKQAEAVRKKLAGKR